MTIKEYIQKYPKENYSTIASRIPCSPQYISQIASGDKTPSFKMAKRIEQITNGKILRSNWYE